MAAITTIDEFNPSAEPGCGPLVAADALALRPLRQQIFETIRAAGTLPRVQVAKDLGISPASVTTLTSELIEIGLLEEVTLPRESGEGARGRPPVALGVRADAHVAAGIKLSDRVHTAVLLDFAGKQLAEEELRVGTGDTRLEDMLDAAERLLSGLARNAGLDRGAISALGLGVPGFVDHASGRVLWSPVMEAGGADVARAATERLGLPVTIDNDANLVALAELWFGIGRRRSDFAVVTIEHGVGLGLVLNKRLYRGAQGLGVELGHMKVQLDGALCRCGQRGCLEAYVADYALAREANTALNWHGKDGRPMNVQLESLYDHAKAGNLAARSIFRRAGRYLALGIGNVVNLFDPALIILSGERMRYDYLYAADTLSELDSLVLKTARPLPEIKVHAWGDLLWAYGAAALALSAVTERRIGQIRAVAAQ